MNTGLNKNNTMAKTTLVLRTERKMDQTFFTIASYIRVIQSVIPNQSMIQPKVNTTHRKDLRLSMELVEE